jgi:hypothetical protein
VGRRLETRPESVERVGDSPQWVVLFEGVALLMDSNEDSTELKLAERQLVPAIAVIVGAFVRQEEVVGVRGGLECAHQ